MSFPRLGLPENVVAWGALALGVAALVGGAAALRAARRREKVAVLVLAGIAALLSWGYVHAYLRGGPRIIDATSYWLEARALAAGHVTWPTGEPETASLGRFLVRSEGADGARAGVLFPPGYPLLLALGFLAGAPMAVGPLLAAALVLATFALGREVTRGREDLAAVPLLAAALSAVCGALRYHTADTMSHGLAALCFTLALTCALRARGAAGRPMVWAALAGLAGGWLFAARPVSGLACAVVVGVTLGVAEGKGPADAPTASTGPAVGPGEIGHRLRLLGAAAAGALPFALLFLLHQRLVTGHWLVSAHAASYATNDGPAGCFRYGFGEGVGCWGEHGDFVRANLPHGFGPWAALETTARRLRMHLVDAGNAEPLALLVPAGAAYAWRHPPARAAALAVAAQIAAYVPFYFDGNYPGGGARFYADVLPAEHVLLALAAVALAAGAGTRLGLALRIRGSGAFVVGLALAGFALRAGHDHAQLRDRDGGAPLFSESALALGIPPAGAHPAEARTAPSMEGSRPAAGLLFVETDAAYNLAFDPGARAAGGIEVVRWKGDALDTHAWLSRGSPPSFLARFVAPSGGARGHVVVEPYSPNETAFLHGGSLWPPIAQEGGAYALPVHVGHPCAVGRALRLLRGAEAGGTVRVLLPAKLVAGRTIDLAVLSDRGAAGEGDVTAALRVLAGEVEIAAAVVAVPPGAEPACGVALQAAIPDGASRVAVTFSPRWAAGGDPDGQPVVALARVAPTSP